MGAFKLILHPADPDCIPESLLALIDALSQRGFLGRPFPCAERRCFLVGSRFVQLVTFLGCSPHIELDPPEGGDAQAAETEFCHVRILGPLERPRFWRGDPGARPRCPACRASLAPPRLVGNAASEEVTCASCGHRARAGELIWRRGAGTARLFLEVWGVHPHEAVPSAELMQALAHSGTCDWTYFYAHPQAR